jgi:hypothetical protein
MTVKVRHLLRGLLAIGLLLGAWVSWFAAPHADRTTKPDASSSVSIEGVRIDPSTVIVPSVTALHGAFAQDVLRATNLRPGRITLELSHRPWGSVIAQSVEPGTNVPPRTTIDLVVAQGAAPARCWPNCERTSDHAPKARPSSFGAAEGVGPEWAIGVVGLWGSA